MKKMVWNVYRHDINKDEIIIENILDYNIIKDFLNKQKERKITKEEFGEELDAELRYWFWSKSQHEVIVKSWSGGRAEKKVDVYEQIKNNFHVFLDYCWQYVGQ